MTAAVTTAAVPGSGLDIIVFVAHLELPNTELNALTGRMLGELNWPAISERICLIVSDSSEFEGSADRSVLVVHASAAASMFRERARVLEAAPHDLLISFGAYLPAADTIAQLRVAARNEELISAVAPRIAIGPRGELMALGPRAAPNASGLIDPRYAPKLAPAYYLPEMLCPCMLLSGTMTGNLDVPDAFDHFPDLILAFLRAARRRGLLVRIDNHLIVSAAAEFESAMLHQDAAKMLQLFDDYELAARRLAATPALADERRLQIMRKRLPEAAGSLLLDCANVPPSFNGSAEHALGILRGVAQMEHRWDVAVNVTDEARSFFSLDDRFPAVRFLSGPDDSYYDCAIRLSQPWALANLADLNERARAIAVTILDTIGPDVIYAVPEEAEDAFQFAAEYADGLIYISEFSRDQFQRRFARHPDLVESVIHLSLDPREYVSDPDHSDREWILIFGNAYDHKDLERTTKIVSAAFPFEQIKVVGRRDLGGMNVEAFDSGALKSEFVETLFRRAKCVLFPSFYEGFGLPLLRGLAHGKTVIARRSRVFRETVERFPNVGCLVEFDNSLDLVPILGAVLHDRGEVLSRDVTPASPGIAVHDWKASAIQLFDFADVMRKLENVEVWRERDRALRYVRSRRG